MKTLQALIFDVDGTLADTEDGHRQSFNKAFAENNLPWNWDAELYDKLAGFVGDLQSIGARLKQAREAKEKPVPKVLFKAGESVRVKEGPFKNFNGTIEETNLEKGKIKVMISILSVQKHWWRKTKKEPL
mgnify:CR=1 FL=1